jgi:hypothetical protein
MISKHADQQLIDGEPRAAANSVRLQISNASARLHKEYVGRGPANSRVTIDGDLVVAILEGGLTRVEQTLSESARDDLVPHPPGRPSGRDALRVCHSGRAGPGAPIAVVHECVRSRAQPAMSALRARAARQHLTAGGLARAESVVLSVWPEGVRRDIWHAAHPRRIRTHDLAHGAMRGVIASMAMTGMRELTVSLGLVEQAPPQQLAGEASGRRRAMIELGHWTFRAVGAVGFGMLPRRRRSGRGPGPLYGLGLWSGFEATAANARALEPLPADRGGGG